MLFHFHNIIYQNSSVDLQRTKQNYSVFTSPSISVRQKKICNEPGKAFQADVRAMKKNPTTFQWHHIKWWKPCFVFKTGVVFKNSNGWFWQTSNCNTVASLQAIFFDLIRWTVVFFSFCKKALLCRNEICINLIFNLVTTE